jgi:hypothetical protein
MHSIFLYLNNNFLFIPCSFLSFQIFMSSSDEFYDAESDTVEDLDTPTVEANSASLTSVVHNHEQDVDLPKPRLPTKEKPPRPPPPKFGVSKSVPRPNTLPVNFRLGTGFHSKKTSSSKLFVFGA